MSKEQRAEGSGDPRPPQQRNTGPWSHVGYGDVCQVTSSEDMDDWPILAEVCGPIQTNADLIANAPADLAWARDRITNSKQSWP